MIQKQVESRKRLRTLRELVKVAHVKLALACFVVAISLTSGASGQMRLGCGDDCRIVTRDSSVLKGELRLSTTDSLALWSAQTGLQAIARSDVTDLSRAYRKWASGVLFGSLVGTVCGLMWRLSSMEIGLGEAEDGSNEDWKFYVPILVCGAVGGVIGYHHHGFRQVELKMIPICDASSRGEISMNLNLVVHF